MTGIRELSLNEITVVSGGGHGGDGDDRHYGYQTSGGVNGGRSNYPNYDGVVTGPGVAKNLSGDCVTSIGIGTLNVVAAGASRSTAAFMGAAASALNDIGKTCDKPSSRSGPPFR